MNFWKDFKTLFNYRLSWHIQNIFLDAFKDGVNSYEKEKSKELLSKHKIDIDNKRKNNPFYKNRKQVK